ncbi:MAG: hypothetical protein KDD37_02850 [Bdellovibrionales bacterium]|nr:hypothetical protein [Bdellovibrionales bacterium]
MMKIYLFLVPLFLVIACSKRIEDEHTRVLIPWPNESGKYSLQVVNIETLNDMREMKGSAAELYVQAGLNKDSIKGVKPNAQFSKSSKGYWVPKDTITQEMASIYAHMERLKALDQEIGIDILLSWPRQIGVETIATDSRNNKRIYENAMYISEQDVMLFFPYRRNQLPISLNAGIIAHEHFHSIFQRIVLDPLSARYNIEEMNRESISLKPRTDAEIEKKETVLNNMFILRGLNEGLADVWGSIYTGEADFISPSLRTLQRNTSPLNTSEYSLQAYVPIIRASQSMQTLENAAYALGTQYARSMRKAMGEEKLASSTKMGQAIFVVERMTRLRDLLIDGFDNKVPAEVLLQAIYKKDELNAENCKWINPLLEDIDSEYKTTCKALLAK